MSKDSTQNIAASVRQRLLNKARSDKRPFSELLQYFGMERFLYRLSQSSYVDKFILKGALMFRAWQAPMFRPTMDIDMLGRYNRNEVAKIVEQIREICAVMVEPDGLMFDTTTIKGDRITEDADYEGVRVRFVGQLGTARIPMQVDIGFGDVVVPEPQEAVLPTMLDFPPPRLIGYSLESAIAEKFEAMVKLGELNSRIKDFYDIWLLVRQFDFQSEIVWDAVSATLKNRGTILSDEITAFSASFIVAKAPQWQAFCKRLGRESVPVDFDEVVGLVASFLSPIAALIRSGEQPFLATWKAPGPWR